MSSLVHTAHAVLGWLALAEGVAAFLRSSLGWARRRDWTPLEDRLGLAFAVTLDVQFLFGLALWLGVSVLGVQALGSEGLEVVRSPELRFWVVIHPVLMTGALALAHAARIRLRRTPAGPARHRVAALLLGGALALVGVTLA